MQLFLEAKQEFSGADKDFENYLFTSSSEPQEKLQ